MATREGSQETELGDTVTLQLAASTPLGAGSPRLAPAFVLEALGEWQGRERRDGDEVGSSGGHPLFLAPGLRVARDGWSAAVSFAFPVAVELHGHPEYRVLTTLGRVFGAGRR
jgi:hypothetical protein